MESLPEYVPVVFALTTVTSIGFLLKAVSQAGSRTFPSLLLIFLLPFWLLFQAILALAGFYQDFLGVPPRLVLFAIVPALLLIAVYLIFFRRSFIEKLPLKTLTILHLVRIPVEIVLLWLFFGGQVPQMMTFEGRNFDILSGIAAPIVYWAAFKKSETRRGVLIAFNVLGLILLANVVSIAALSLPSAIQQLNFDQPSRAVLYFPYIWLPAIVVPIVLFAHLASLLKLYKKTSPLI
jgi:hypothetical protein